MSTAADAFREINRLAAKTRRTFYSPDYEGRTVGEYLLAIQGKAQDGLREALANQLKLDVFDAMKGAASKMADFLGTWRDCLAGVQMCEDDFDGSSGLKEYQAAISKAATTSTGEPT